MKQQLNALVHAEFLATTSWAWLLQYPRYFGCIRHRLQRIASGGLTTEIELLTVVRPHADRLQRRRETTGTANG